MNDRMLRDIIGARPKSLVLVACLLLLSLALLLFRVYRQQPALETAQSAWFAKREALAGGQNLGVAERFQNGGRDLAAFRQRLIPKKDFPRFLSRLFGTAAGNAVPIKGIVYKPAPVPGEDVLAYGIAFTVSGKYPSVKSFLADLARYPEMVTIDSVSLSNASQTEESVELRIQITAYLKVEGA